MNYNQWNICSLVSETDEKNLVKEKSFYDSVTANMRMETVAVLGAVSQKEIK